MAALGDVKYMIVTARDNASGKRGTPLPFIIPSNLSLSSFPLSLRFLPQTFSLFVFSASRKPCGGSVRFFRDLFFFVSGEGMFFFYLAHAKPLTLSSP